MYGFILVSLPSHYIVHFSPLKKKNFYRERERERERETETETETERQRDRQTDRHIERAPTKGKN